MPKANLLKTPAFWDLHLHGIAGIDFMRADVDAMVFACEELGKNGIGFFAPTLLSAEKKLLTDACLRQGAFHAKAQKKKFLPKRAAFPIGVHLEGPFLSAKSAGAHPHSALMKPDISFMMQLLAATQGNVAIVTLAPELAGALPLIHKLRQHDIRIQIGHTHATVQESLAAVKAGARGITHLYNAMRVHHRHPGPLALLSRGLVTAEIITDGVHLDIDFLEWCWKACGDHLYAVSDGCSAVHAKAGARLTLGDIEVVERGGAAYVKREAEDVGHTPVLAGGATYLTEHPAILKKGAVFSKHPKAMLKLFHSNQARFFAKAAKRESFLNHFDNKTLKLLRE